MLEILARRHMPSADPHQSSLAAEFDALQQRPAPWADAKDQSEARGAAAVEQKEAWEECCSLFRTAVSQCAWASLVSDAEWSADGLYTIMSRVDINAFECCCSPSDDANAISSDGSAPCNTKHEPIPSGTPCVIPCGTALYLGRAPYLNHSCAPTCAPENGMATLTIKTMAALPSGSPLTIAYVDTSMRRSVRRRSLEELFGFECHCSRCVEQGGEAWLADLPLACHVLAVAIALLAAAGVGFSY